MKRLSLLHLPQLENPDDDMCGAAGGRQLATVTFTFLLLLDLFLCVVHHCQSENGMTKMCYNPVIAPVCWWRTVLNQSDVLSAAMPSCFNRSLRLDTILHGGGLTALPSAWGYTKKPYYRQRWWSIVVITPFSLLNMKKAPSGR